MQWHLMSNLSPLIDAWLLLEKVHGSAASSVLSLQCLSRPFLLIAGRKDTRAVQRTNIDTEKPDTPPHVCLGYNPTCK